MRLDNLSKESKDRVLLGDKQHLKEILKEELDGIKKDLIDFPIDRVEELRGKARILVTLLKLLGE